MYRKILVATDLTDASQPALRTGLALARRLGAEVTLLHVVQTPYRERHWFAPFGDRDLSFMKEIEAKEWEAAERLLVQQARDADPEKRDGAPLRTMVRAGIAADEIVKAASDQQFDLIVIGTHARKGMKHMLLGSIAERVLRTAPCPVMTIGPGGER
jgi:universal stress protein A